MANIYDMLGLNESVDSSEFIFDVPEVQLEDFNDPVIGSMAVEIHMEAATAKLEEYLGIMELNTLNEGGIEALNEGVGEKIEEWAKAALEWLKRIAGYVKAFFNKALVMIQATFGGDETINEKVKPVLERIDDALSVEFTGYKFTIPETTGNVKNDISAMADDIKSNVSKFIETYVDDKSKQLTIASNMINASKGVELSKLTDIRIEAFKAYRDGEESKSKQYVSDVYGSVSELVNKATGLAKAKKTANSDYANAKKAINDAIKGVEKVKKVVKELSTSKILGADGTSLKLNTAPDSTINKATSAYLQTLKALLNAQNSVHAVHLSALKAQNTQAKNVIRKILRKGKVVTGKDANGRGAFRESSLLSILDFD